MCYIIFCHTDRVNFHHIVWNIRSLTELYLTYENVVMKEMKPFFSEKHEIHDWKKMIKYSFSQLLKGQDSEMSSLAENVPNILHNSEFMKFAYYLENWSSVGQKCQVGDLFRYDDGFFKNDPVFFLSVIWFFKEWHDLFICVPTFWLVFKVTLTFLFVSEKPFSSYLSDLTRCYQPDFLIVAHFFKVTRFLKVTCKVL